MPSTWKPIIQQIQTKKTQIENIQETLKMIGQQKMKIMTKSVAITKLKQLRNKEIMCRATLQEKQREINILLQKIT